jgi:outer membrane murein-binding lipoprotein Lpp
VVAAEAAGSPRRRGRRAGKFACPNATCWEVVGNLMNKDLEMPRLTNLVRRALPAAIVVVGGLSLSACATRDYVDEQIAAVNAHIASVDARVTTVDAKASDALARADAAARTAQTAATDAQAANQRLDQLGARVDTLERTPAKRARH